MSALTEAEILDCLTSNLRSAIDHCEKLAVAPRKGPAYRALRDALKLIEGCCIQIAYWRDGDTRWLTLGDLMEEAHQRSLHWLRYHYPQKMFAKLAENLRAIQKIAKDLETKATGRSGPILPEVLLSPEQRQRQAVVPSSIERITPGGIIIPPGVAA